MEFVCGDGDEGVYVVVDVDVYDFEVGVVIGFVVVVGDVMVVVDVGFDGVVVVGFEVVGFGVGIDDFDVEFVVEDVWVVEEWLFVGEGVEIGIVNVDMVNVDEGFVGGEDGFGSVVGGGE